MSRPAYDAAKEHEIVGMYPGVPGAWLSDEGFPPTPKFYRPISPLENYHAFFETGNPCWMPHNGWFACDVNEFRPRQHLDNLGNHQCLDGGPRPDYEATHGRVIGWFDTPLIWEPVSGGCMPEPGWRMFTDINEWPDKVVWPDLDEIDWDEMREMNVEFLGTDKVNQLGIQLGFWERLMNLMGVDNAAIALVDPTQEEALHAFLDKLADLYCDYVERVSKIGRIDSLMLHDDWGTQNGPFFSLETARKHFVAPIKKLVDKCHELGIIFQHHSCGKAESLVPAMIEEGADYWEPQVMLNDLKTLVKQYEGQFHFSVCNPILPKGSTPEEIYEIAREFVDTYAPYGVLMAMNTNASDIPEHDDSLYPLFADAVYEISRIRFAEAEA